MESLDEFSSPVTIRIDKNDGGRQTSCGGFVTLLIVIWGASYFIYLFYDWLSGNMPANVTAMVLDAEANYTLPLSYSPFQIVLTDLNKNPVPSNILNVIGVEQYIKENSLVQCSMYNGPKPPKYRNFSYCYEIQNGKTDLNINEKFGVLVARCSERLVEECASKEEIDDYLEENLTILLVGISEEEFSTTKDKMLPFLQTASNVISPSILSLNQVTILFEQTTVDRGVFFPRTTDYYSLGDISESSTVLNEEEFENYIENYFKFDPDMFEIITMTSIEFDSRIKQTAVTYAKLGEVFAEFNSIMSLVLLITIFSVLFSRTAEYELLSEIFYKNVYRKAGKSFQGTFKGIRGVFNIFTDFSNIRRKISNHKASEEEKEYLEIYEKIDEELELETIVSDIEKLKTAVRLLYTPEQWKIATEYVGVRLLPEGNNILDEREPLNHLEMIEELEKQNAAKYWKSYQKYKAETSTSSELDERIKDCLLDESEVQLLYGEQFEQSQMLIEQDEASEMDGTRVRPTDTVPLPSRSAINSEANNQLNASLLEASDNDDDEEEEKLEDTINMEL